MKTPDSNGDPKDEKIFEKIEDLNNWSENAIFVFDVLSSVVPGEFTLEELLKVSEEEMRGSIAAFCDMEADNIEDDDLEQKAEIGILEIIQWLDDNGYELSSGFDIDLD